MIQTAARAGLRPDEVLDVANRHLSPRHDLCMFVTVFCGLLDLGNGELVFANGGHDAPYLLNGGESVLPVGEGSGPVLGVNTDFVYSSQTLRLAPGNLLFLYTDGVTEAMDRNERLFGQGRIESYLNRRRNADEREVVEGVLEEVRTVHRRSAAIGRYHDACRPIPTTAVAGTVAGTGTGEHSAG